MTNVGRLVAQNGRKKLYSIAHLLRCKKWSLRDGYTRGDLWVGRAFIHVSDE